MLLNVSVVVVGERSSGNRFAEHTKTSVVNAHGAMITLRELVHGMQMLRVRNARTGEERACHAVNVSERTGGKAKVGIEFVEASPRFWRIAFPPEDWTPNSPEAKHARRQAAHISPDE